MTFIKLVAIMFLGSLAFFSFATVATVGYVASGGIANVSVEGPDADFSIPIPMRVLDIGLGVANLAIPDSELREVQAELNEGLGEYRPVLEEIAGQLRDFPEGELVRVTTGSERVTVEHSGGKFRVEVIGPDTHIRVAIPRRAMSRLAKKTLNFTGPGLIAAGG